MSPQIAVAATAPFGADVLERLAAEPRHQRGADATGRPRGPRAEGRRSAGEGGSGTTRAPRAPAGAPRARSRARRADGRDRRVREADPRRAARRATLAQRPPVASSALERGGPGRAIADGRRCRDRRDDPRDGQGAGRRPDPGAARVPRRAGWTMPATCTRRRRRSRSSCSTRCSPTPSLSSRPQAEVGVTYADRIGPDDRVLDLSRPARELVDLVRALSPHIGARAELEGRSVTIWRARVGRGRLVRAGGAPAGRRTQDGVRGVATRAQVSPARQAAFRVLLRVFENDAYADRAFRAAAEGLDDRDRALARRLAFGAVQRVRTLDYAIETLGRRRVHRLDAAGTSRSQARGVSARVRRRGASACGRERIRRARPRSRTGARGSVHECRSAAACGRLAQAPRRAL